MKRRPSVEGMAGARRHAKYYQLELEQAIWRLDVLIARLASKAERADLAGLKDLAQQTRGRVHGLQHSVEILTLEKGEAIIFALDPPPGAQLNNRRN